MPSPTPQEQALAAAALLDPTGPARDQLIESVHGALGRSAARWVSSSPALRGRLDANDLVQHFLTEKVLPEIKLAKLLAPVAAGRIPLGPRLRRSLNNFANSLLRRRDVLAGAAPVGPGATDPPLPADVWPDVLERVGEQLACLRAARPALEGGRVPYFAVLLLVHRLELAVTLATCFGDSPGGSINRESASEVAEQLTHWTHAEMTLRFPPLDKTLRRTWQELAAAAADAAALSADHVFRAVGLGSRNGWNVWVLRARLRLGEAESDRARALFPTWQLGDGR